MKIFSSLIGIILSALLLTNCQKKSDPAPNQTTKTDHLTASTWKVIDVGIDLNKDGQIDPSGSALGVFPCLADNTLLFKKDNTGTADDGTTRCSTSDPQTTTINWSFADAEKSLNISNSSISLINGKSKIIELNAGSLILSKDTTISGLGPFVLKMTH